MTEASHVDQWSFQLGDFPQSFMPLVVVVGDRREGRPKTVGDVLAYSVSTIDILFLAQLNLPTDTLIVSDKVFQIESEKNLADRFRDFNILTIGSPAGNLFSRRINDNSLFRFVISDTAKRSLVQQERILEPYRLDRAALEFYIAIVTAKVQSFDGFLAWAGREPGEFSDIHKRKFETILKAVAESELDSYRGLLREFAGSAITDPIVSPKAKPNLTQPRHRGFILKPNIDFGLISLARHPYAEDKSVIYVAGMHGPGTAYGLRLLANPREWSRPYGGVFEVQIPVDLSFGYRLQESTHEWQTIRYDAIPGFALNQLQTAKPIADLRVFISLPMSGHPRNSSDQPLLALKGHEIGRDLNTRIEWVDPFTLPLTWDFSRGIQVQFPLMDFIVHDITEFSPGVMFEVGCSLSLHKRTALLWDLSRKPFDAHRLPTVMRQMNIVAIDFSEPDRLAAAVEQRIKSQMNDQPNAVEPETEHESIAVLVLTSPSCEATLRPHLSAQLQARHRGRVKWEAPNSLDMLVAWIEASEYIIVAGGAGYAEGNLALGIAHTKSRRVLELHSSDSSPNAMSKGLKRAWETATVATDIQYALNVLFGTTTAGV